ncbi:MAG: HD domain-containing protein [Acidimicrobiales bacterium]
MDLLLRSGSVTDTVSSGGDRVGILEHGLQCADVLRRRSPEDLELQVAGLVHDVGHVAVPGAADLHGAVGRVLVGELLGERVADLVELHVAAKRYLVTVDPSYHGDLSDASVRTLREQGGAMTPDEVTAFESEPRHRDAVALRRADEAAKVPGRHVPGLEAWRPVIERVAARA